MKVLAWIILANGLSVDLVKNFTGWLNENLGRPYVWGATGHKSYDCSGFVWRMLTDNGVLIKRTTARKLYMATEPAEKAEFGTLVFFDDLKHVGIVRDKDTFFHAATSQGTTQSPFAPYWRTKIVGLRKMPAGGAE